MKTHLLLARIIGIIALGISGGCGLLGDSILEEYRSWPLTGIFLPEKAHAHKPFTLTVDLDIACIRGPELIVREDSAAARLYVDVMGKRSAGCTQAIVINRLEKQIIINQTGPYSIVFQGYRGPKTKAITIVNESEPIPEQTPPPLSKSSDINY